MLILILVAFAIPLALGFLGVLSGLAVLAAEIGVLLISAWLFDRGRRPGAGAPFRDENRADIAAPMADHSLYIAKEVAERPADRPAPD